MRALSPGAVPLVGSAGDRNRIRRLLRQLPPHDNDPRYCHVTLSREQEQDFASFCARRKHDALGRGVVRPLVPVDQPPADVICRQVLTYISPESQTTRNNVLWSRASVCLSAAECPHYCTDPDVTWGVIRDAP